MRGTKRIGKEQENIDALRVLETHQGWIHLKRRCLMATVSPHAQNDNPNYTVYALIDPRDYLTRYIGITTDADKRFSQHMECRGKNIQKDNWIRGLKNIYAKPIMRELETVKGFECAREREDYWIKHYLDAGIELYQAITIAVKSTPDDLPIYSPGRTSAGRTRTNEQIRDIILYRLTTGEWPDINSDMRFYYNKHYIEKTGRYHTRAMIWLKEYREIKA